MAASETPARDAVLAKYLNEAYGKEKQLETALATQIAQAKRSQLKKGLQDHLKVTKAQSKGLQKRIKELGGKAEAGPDVPGPEVLAAAATAAANLANRAIAGAKGPVQALRGTGEADNELRNIRDCLWNEAEEIAHYNVIETTATELGDKETAKLARTYRRQEEKMQGLLNRQVKPLVKAVIREEVPAAERRVARNGGRSASARRGTGARRSASGASRSGSGSGSGGSTAAGRRSTAQKAAATRTTKAARTSAKSTASTARTSAKRTASSAGSTARKTASAARSTAKRAGS